MLSVYAAPGRPCYRCLFPEMPDPETVPSCAQAGVLGTVPGLFGTLQAHEALKLILGIGEPLIGALLTVDLLAMRFQKSRLPRDPHCPVCGDAPTIRALAETEWVCASTPHFQADETCATEQQATSTDELPWLSLEAGRRCPALRWIDVRTEAEFAAGHIPGAEHMPLDRIESLPARVGPDDALLLYCQRGERAVRAYHLLKGTLQGRLSLLQDGYEGWLRGGLAETADVTVGGMEPPSLAVVERS